MTTTSADATASANITAPGVASYITISAAADLLSKTFLNFTPWQVVDLIERGALEAIRYGNLVLVPLDGVEAIGGQR